MKAAIYARYSSDNQREESIDAQIRAIKEYAERNNYVIVKIYTDEARSATTDNRPQFLQMVIDSELGLFDALLVHKLDRFSRDRYDSAHYKRILKKNGVKLISILEHLDDSPESIILESVLQGMAEYYSRNLAREVNKGMKETALQCKHNGGTPPLGYDVAMDKSYIINEAEAKAVKLIFESYEAGKSYTQIISLLNELGYKTKKGSSFGKNSLYEILRNEKYAGTYIFNKASSKVAGKRNQHKIKNSDEIIRIENGIPAIIDKELFCRVQERMNKNARGPGTNKAKELYLLSGIIFCGKCNGAMVGNRKFSGRNKDLYATYECATRKRSKCCDGKSINRDYVGSLVIENIERKVLSKEAIDKLAVKIYEYAKSQNMQIEEDLQVFEKELAAVQTQIDNMVNAIASGLFHPSMKEKMDNLEQRKADLSRKMVEAKFQADTTSPSSEIIKQYLLKDTDIKNKSPEDQKRIIQTYVQKVIVYENYIDVHIIVDFIGQTVRKVSKIGLSWNLLG